MKFFIIRKIKGLLIQAISEHYHSILPDLNNNQIVQRQLFFQYQNLQHTRKKLPSFADTGFRVYSQSDEDGILLFIFALIGFKSKKCIDIAFDNPYGANVTNLICNWGFSGLLIEGKDIKASEQFFSRHKDTTIYPPKIIRAWITTENVNRIISESGISGEIDLLSLDMDGVDYWIWKSIKSISPRVVVLEYMNIFGADDSVTVPYTPDFNRFVVHKDFFGASLKAFVKLGKKKGYRLIGCNKYGYNAFFLRNDIGRGIFPEVNVASCLSHSFAAEGRRSRLPEVKKMGWVKV